MYDELYIQDLEAHNAQLQQQLRETKHQLERATQLIEDFELFLNDYRKQQEAK